MMLTGWDMGHATIKVVLMEDGVCLAAASRPHSGNPGRIAEWLWKHLTECTGLFPSDMDWCAATGCFVHHTPRLDGVFPMAAALARGASWLCPDVHRVVDLGEETALCVDFEKGGRTLHSIAPLLAVTGVGKILGMMPDDKKQASPPGNTAPKNLPHPAILRHPYAVMETGEEQASPEKSPVLLHARAIELWLRSLAGENCTTELIRELGESLYRSLPSPAHKKFLLSGSLALSPPVRDLLTTCLPCLLIPEAPFTGALGAALLAHENAGQGLYGPLPPAMLAQAAL